MLSIVDSKPISELVGKYFDRLKNTGSIDKSLTKRFMLYLFLVGFIDTVYVFLSEKDYRKIDALLANVFAGCNCILAYDKNVTLTSHYLRLAQDVNDVVIGKPWYMGNVLRVRIGEDVEETVYRFTESDNLRVAENG